MSERRGGFRSGLEPRVAWAVAALALVLLIGGGVWDNLRAGSGGAWWDDLTLLLALVAFPIVGALVVSRFERNPLGWVLIATGVFGGLVVFSMTYALDGLGPGSQGLPGATLAAWFANWTWYPTIQLIFPFLLLFFPTGALPSRRWRPVLWLSLAVMATTSILPMLQHRLKDGSRYDVDNPIGIAAIDNAEKMLDPAFALLFGVSGLAVVSLVARYRRSTGVERMQLKWFTLAAGILVISVFLEEIFKTPGYLFSVGIAGLPISMGLAILRYRLYEIDVIINRALVYGVLTSLAVVVYLGLVFALQLVLEPLTPDSDLAIAASTLAVAALFRPMRSQVQGFIDRRFYRRKYDAGRAIGDFSARLRDEVDLRIVRADVLGVINQTVQPTHASLWLRAEGAER